VISLEFADTENVPAVPLHDVPSAISALTVLIGTLTATEAPTPTFDPLPPPSEGSAVPLCAGLVVPAVGEDAPRIRRLAQIYFYGSVTRIRFVFLGSHRRR